MGAFFMSVVSAFAGAAEACRPTGALQNVEVARVVDGDTVRLRDGRSVRLIGINAPELAHNGRTTEPFAEAAKQRLQALVSASDGRLALQPGRQARDHYGRTLAHLFDASGANLEARLLGEGLGYLVAVAPNTELTACQQAAERAARSANLVYGSVRRCFRSIDWRRAASPWSAGGCSRSNATGAVSGWRWTVRWSCGSSRRCSRRSMRNG